MNDAKAPTVPTLPVREVLQKHEVSLTEARKTLTELLQQSMGPGAGALRAHLVDVIGDLDEVIHRVHFIRTLAGGR